MTKIYSQVINKLPDYLTYRYADFDSRQDQPSNFGRRLESFPAQPKLIHDESTTEDRRKQSYSYGFDSGF